jgi:large subunit ribosomal protein L19
MEKKISTSLLQIIEEKHRKLDFSIDKNLTVGEIVEVSYKVFEGDKERLQTYEGIIIAKNNKNLGKTITLRRTIQGIGVEQIFFLNSPKIQKIKKKDKIRVRRSKLYFLRKT